MKQNYASSCCIPLPPLHFTDGVHWLKIDSRICYQFKTVVSDITAMAVFVCGNKTSEHHFLWAVSSPSSPGQRNAACFLTANEHHWLAAEMWLICLRGASGKVRSQKWGWSVFELSPENIAITMADNRYCSAAYMYIGHYNSMFYTMWPTFGGALSVVASEDVCEKWTTKDRESEPKQVIWPNSHFVDKETWQRVSFIENAPESSREKRMAKFERNPSCTVVCWKNKRRTHKFLLLICRYLIVYLLFQEKRKARGGKVRIYAYFYIYFVLSNSIGHIYNRYQWDKTCSKFCKYLVYRK